MPNNFAVLNNLGYWYVPLTMLQVHVKRQTHVFNIPRDQLDLHKIFLIEMVNRQCILFFNKN